MKIIFGWIVLIVGAIAGLYVGGWLMFIKPIIEACQHFDAGTLTGMIVGATVLKCIFANVVSGIIMYVAGIISNVLFAKSL